MAGDLEGFFKDLKDETSDEVNQAGLSEDSEVFFKPLQKTGPFLEFVNIHHPVECGSLLAKMRNGINDGAIERKLKEIETLVDRYRFKAAEEKLLQLRKTFSFPSGR